MSTLPEAAGAPASAPDFLSIAEAALILDCSQKTVRRRVKAGQIAAELHQGPHGEEYRIPRAALSTLEGQATRAAVHSRVPSGEGEPVQATLPGGESAQGGHVQGTQDAGAVAGLLEMVSESWQAREEAQERETALRQQIADQAARIAALEETARERDFLRERLVEAEQSAREQRVLTLRAQERADRLEAQLVELTAPKALPATTEPPTSEQQEIPRPRSWWRFWGR